MTTSARSTSVGYGFVNTSLIVLLYGNGKYAAKMCTDLVLNGYNDWYLPTFDEIKLMFSNLLLYKKGNFFIPVDVNGNRIDAPSPYWTSTEATASTAFIIDMREKRANGEPYTKNFDWARVRAIRSF